MPDRLDVLENRIPEIFFQLEEAALSHSEKPLYATHRVLLLLSDLLEVCSESHRHTDFRDQCVTIHTELKHSVEGQGSWHSDLVPLIVSWITLARSEYLLVESFYLTSHQSEFDDISHQLINSIQTQNVSASQDYFGEFNGRLKTLDEGLLRLSEIGFWSIDYCSNQVEAMPVSDTPNVSARLRLTTHLSLRDVRQYCGREWNWSHESQVTLDALPDNIIRSNHARETLAFLKRFAIEREAWRHNFSLGRLQADMESYVLSQAKPLGDLYRLDAPSNLHVLSVHSMHLNVGIAEGALLAQGNVHVLTEADIISYELASVLLPVYKVEVAGETLVVPAYFSGSEVSQDSEHIKLAFLNGHWLESNSWGEAQLEITRGNRRYILVVDEIERAYATPIRTAKLPTNVINVWSVRGELLEEYQMPDEMDRKVLAHANQRQLQSICNTPISTIAKRIKLAECLVSGVKKFWVAASLIGAVVPSEGGTCFQNSMLLFEDSLVPILNASHQRDKKGVFVIVRAGGIIFSVYCATIVQLHVEHVATHDGDFEGHFTKWASGNVNDLRVVCEAEVFALYRLLLRDI